MWDMSPTLARAPRRESSGGGDSAMEGKSNGAGKICPLTREKCTGDLCAWWYAFAKDCALLLLSCIMADSTVCQNVWEKEDRPLPERGENI